MEKCIRDMKKIFIDGGARAGESVYELLDKREDLKGCDVYLFECNQDHIATLKNLKENNLNYNFIVREEALWDENGEKDFFISIDQWGDLGCTLDPTKREKLDLENPRLVKTISLSEFILSFSDDEYIVLKLDVEGAEYRIVPDLLKSGAINKIKELYIEWHDHFFNNSSYELKAELNKHNIIINSWM